MRRMAYAIGSCAGLSAVEVGHRRSSCLEVGPPEWAPGQQTAHVRKAIQSGEDLRSRVRAVIPLLGGIAAITNHGIARFCRIATKGPGAERLFPSSSSRLSLLIALPAGEPDRWRCRQRRRQQDVPDTAVETRIKMQQVRIGLCNAACSAAKREAPANRD